MIGNTLGNYQIAGQIGKGGMGEVYVADDINLSSKVALKFLPDAFSGDPERMARFERDAKLLASLNHSKIAAIYGLEHAEGKRFPVLELVEGETLAQKLNTGPSSTIELFYPTHSCFRPRRRTEGRPSGKIYSSEKGEQRDETIFVVDEPGFVRFCTRIRMQ
jgi:serine/threonine protein kinase